MKIFLNWLFAARGVANIKDLTRRKFTMGAQSVFALWTLCQPVIMFATDETAIARMRIYYGLPADILGGVGIAVGFGIDS